MSIAHTATIVHTLIFFSVDVPAMRGQVKFAKTVDGQPAGEVEFGIEGADLAALMMAHPNAAVARNIDIEEAVSGYAIAKTIIAGVVL